MTVILVLDVNQYLLPCLESLLAMLANGKYFITQDLTYNHIVLGGDAQEFLTVKYTRWTLLLCKASLWCDLGIFCSKRTWTCFL